jgi:hypothetical protein
MTECNRSEITNKKLGKTFDFLDPLIYTYTVGVYIHIRSMCTVMYRLYNTYVQDKNKIIYPRAVFFQLCTWTIDL